LTSITKAKKKREGKGRQEDTLRREAGWGERKRKQQADEEDMKRSCKMTKKGAIT
jgi:hypothetical protein